MTEDAPVAKRLDIWLILAVSVVIYRVIEMGVSLALLYIPPMLPRFMFWRVASVEPLLAPVVAVGSAVWFACTKMGMLRALGRKPKIVLAILATVVALCPLVLKRVPVQVPSASDLDVVIGEGYCDDDIAKAIHKTDPRLIDGYNFRDYPGFPTPLARAAERGRTNVVRMLMAKGASQERAIRHLADYDKTNAIELIKRCAQKDE